MRKKKYPSFVFGFHGTSKEIADEVFEKGKMRQSSNEYDWLGTGIYFWEGSCHRAYEFAEEKKKRSHEEYKPCVIGAMIELGSCLNLVDSSSLGAVSNSHDMLTMLSCFYNLPLPENKKANHGDSDFLLRYLDCAVINNVHRVYMETDNKRFDTVRAPFFEGEPLYPNAGFRTKNHIQICVCNPEAIVAVFKLYDCTGNCHCCS
jgi:hypothetical protein